METLTQKFNKMKIRKSDNTIEDFNIDKLVSSCMKCGVSPTLALKIAGEIADEIKEGATTRDIRNLAYNKLFKISPKIATEYHYRSDLKVRTSATVITPFDRQKIVNSLIKETNIDREFAEEIARDVEKELTRLHLNYVTAPLIREIVNVKLLEHHNEAARARYTRLGMPVYDAMKLINSGSKENANLQHNPETIHKLMADSIAKEYALVNVIPTILADAHMKGEIHIHDLDYFATRPFCFSHDIRFFLKHGFKADGTGLHSSVAGPAKRPEVAFLHAAKVLSSAQTNCAGGQGFSYFNTFLAPYIEGLSYKQVKQLAQMFIYEMGQMYVARGGQVVFSSIDLDMSIPKLFEDVPAVTMGGKIKGTYSDYADEIKTLFNALTDVYLEGDYNKRPFNFPKFEVQIYPKEMKKDEEELLKVSKLSAKFGTPYYIINQPYMPDFACYQCCSFLMPLDDANSEEDIQNGTVRGGGLQVITINLPQIAYEAGGDDRKLFELLRDRMEKAKDALLLKRKIIKKNLKHKMLPFMGQPIDDKGTRWLEVDKQSYIIGIIGMNELVKAHLDEELHESKEAWVFGLKVMKKMKDIVAEFREETKLNFALARTPAESAASRLALIDQKNYGKKAVVQGELPDAIYYTNSFQLRPSADVPLFEKLKIEGSFHPLTDGGALTQIWLGEHHPDPEALMELTKKIATKTAIQYFPYTRDLSVCNVCGATTGGLLEKCSNCGAENLHWMNKKL